MKHIKDEFIKNVMTEGGDVYNKCMNTVQWGEQLRDEIKADKTTFKPWMDDTALEECIFERMRELQFRPGLCVLHLPIGAGKSTRVRRATVTALDHEIFDQAVYVKLSLEDCNKNETPSIILKKKLGFVRESFVDNFGVGTRTLIILDKMEYLVFNANDFRSGMKDLVTDCTDFKKFSFFGIFDVREAAVEALMVNSMTKVYCALSMEQHFFGCKDIEKRRQWWSRGVKWDITQIKTFVHTFFTKGGNFDGPDQHIVHQVVDILAIAGTPSFCINNVPHIQSWIDMCCLDNKLKELRNEAMIIDTSWKHCSETYNRAVGKKQQETNQYYLV
jgi:hypothetical protein